MGGGQTMGIESASSAERGRPRRIRRLVETALLMYLHRTPAHGYRLMAALKEMGLEHYPIDSSALYRVLRELERGGAVASAWHIESSAGPPRRVYRITPLGERMLRTWLSDLRETARALNDLLAWYDDEGIHRGEHGGDGEDKE
jgi:PadR family transcriptional regulator, regulatory protein PadR